MAKQCPICGKELRKGYGHFQYKHTKAELIKYICKLLGIKEIW